MIIKRFGDAIGAAKSDTDEPRLVFPSRTEPKLDFQSERPEGGTPQFETWGNAAE